MDFIFIGYYNDLSCTYDINLSGKILWVDRLFCWINRPMKTEITWLRISRKKKTKMKMKLNEWRQLASCYFFPDFLLTPKYIKPFFFVTNQQIINIVLEYKYFVSCWQHNFVNYCLSCDWSCSQNLICCVTVWLPHRPPLFGVRYCDTIGIAGVKKNTDKARFQLVLTGLYLPRRIPVFRYLSVFLWR